MGFVSRMALVTVSTILAGSRLAAAPPAAGSPAVPADAVTEARAVEEALNGLDGLVASFTQTVESAGLPRPQVEKGKVYLLRPGRMRWDYEVPRGKLAIADGRKSYVYLPEERQVLVAPLDPQGTRTGIGLLLNRVDLVGSFEIGWGPGAETGPRPLLTRPSRRSCSRATTRPTSNRTTCFGVCWRTRSTSWNVSSGASRTPTAGSSSSASGTPRTSSRSRAAAKTRSSPAPAAPEP